MAAEDRLDKLDEDIRKARDQAEENGVLDDPDEPKFHESGDLPQSKELDDQQIAPPG